MQNVLAPAGALGLGSTLTTRHITYERELDAAMGIPTGFHSHAILSIGDPMGGFGPVGRGPLAEIVLSRRVGKVVPGIREEGRSRPSPANPTFARPFFGGAEGLYPQSIGDGYGPAARIIRAVSLPLASAASTVPISGPA
jgi:hypothetical protein